MRPELSTLGFGTGGGGSDQEKGEIGTSFGIWLGLRGASPGATVSSSSSRFALRDLSSRGLQATPTRVERIFKLVLQRITKRLEQQEIKNDLKRNWEFFWVFFPGLSEASFREARICKLKEDRRL